MQEAAGALLVMSTVTAGHLLRAGPELNGPLNYVLMDGAAVLNVKTICEFVLSVRYGRSRHCNTLLQPQTGWMSPLY
ncbi:hypothetical protein PF005_g18470 [Phytophthora fragariae]|uniref:Uncharacterized protein n=1 Tax=Phytophthora fragariae TaxID=53985 RepID=A0A6A3WWM6_9STRA|nr:hypothetical protein PF009_g19418 [Phytophthora fragariae]KAE9092345.1 hypothetical protein PF007_g18549 [Phytophthora fragariae]KAE9123444.1 hypothetical protein PF006_g17425 [Phytophthora fragariae]KAE9192409.1 hypothetical protein PF005_g18470 [Phytophthora fragariae]KAE9207250.1 hypothetical protein PF002_g19755 [Phytophthora fragariae]